MKTAVVDRQSATIKIIKDGVVVRELPYRILSANAVLVGRRLLGFSSNGVSGRGREERGEGWLMQKHDRPTHPITLPTRPYWPPWQPTGPKQRFRLEVETLRDRIAASEDEAECAELREAIRALEGREKGRSERAQRQSARKRPTKAERNKSKKKSTGGPQIEKPQTDEAKGKKKKKGSQKKGGSSDGKGKKKGGSDGGNDGGKGASNKGKKSK